LGEASIYSRERPEKQMKGAEVKDKNPSIPSENCSRVRGSPVRDTGKRANAKNEKK